MPGYRIVSACLVPARCSPLLEFVISQNLLTDLSLTSVKLILIAFRTTLANESSHVCCEPADTGKSCRRFGFPRAFCRRKKLSSRWMGSSLLDLK